MTWGLFEHFPVNDEAGALRLQLRESVLEKTGIGKSSIKTIQTFIKDQWHSVCDLADLIGRNTDDLAIQMTVGMVDTTEVGSYPNVESCQSCKRGFGDLMFDACIPTLFDTWGCICRYCFVFQGCQLGLGWGQMFVRGRDGQWYLWETLEEFQARNEEAP